MEEKIFDADGDAYLSATLSYASPFLIHVI